MLWLGKFFRKLFHHPVPHLRDITERSAHLLLPSLELGNSGGVAGLGLSLNRYTKDADDAQNCHTLHRDLL